LISKWNSKILTSFGIFGLFPLVVQIIGIWSLIDRSGYDIITLLSVIVVALANLIAVMSFFMMLRGFYCSSCVNFSCPVNTVEKSVVDYYLSKNEVMKKAWEDSGYKLGYALFLSGGRSGYTLTAG
jgi:hypothetical protein